ncbi:MAG: GntR family transcriptional regulator, partial [Actinobacteria bacterium]|nr:GntR family transcriptional regulator [Actinomycetota bacterium]
MSTFLTIKKLLMDYIKVKNLKVGDKFPPESELARKLNVSRLTLREALKIFREEGLIYTIHGIGTFLSSDFEQINDTLDMNLGTTEMIVSAGYKPGVKFFERKLVKADM